ncbi:MAG: 50S ribosomal protein L35 [Clostridia bacterium]
MPKMKTHSSTKKRVRVTKAGNLKKTTANRAHKLTGKSSKRKMSLKQDSFVDSANQSALKKLLPYK